MSLGQEPKDLGREGVEVSVYCLGSVAVLATRAVLAKPTFEKLPAVPTSVPPVEYLRTQLRSPVRETAPRTPLAEPQQLKVLAEFRFVVRSRLEEPPSFGRNRGRTQNPPPSARPLAGLRSRLRRKRARGISLAQRDDRAPAVEAGQVAEIGGEVFVSQHFATLTVMLSTQDFYVSNVYLMSFLNYFSKKS